MIPKIALPKSNKKRYQNIQSSPEILQEEEAILQMEKRYMKEEQEATFGRNVGQQLVGLDPRQKIIAQKLISDILFHAKLGKLNDFSIITMSSQSREKSSNSTVTIISE